jgi:hypothetical protein
VKYICGLETNVEWRRRGRGTRRRRSRRRRRWWW